MVHSFCIAQDVAGRAAVVKPWEALSLSCNL